MVALSRLNPDKYQEAVSFLRSVISVFKSMKIGERGDWKPVQSGVLMATTSVLDIQEELLNDGYQFLLTSRLTQDCLENLFSVVRLKNSVPSFQMCNISIAQFLKPPGGNHGNYQEDDREFAVDFLSQPVKLPRDPEPEVNDIQISKAESEEELCKAELNSLVGYCVHSMKKTENVCDSCLQDITSSSLVSHQSATLTNSRRTVLSI